MILPTTENLKALMVGGHSTQLGALRRWIKGARSLFPVIVPELLRLRRVYTGLRSAHNTETCKDAECWYCGLLICPHGEPMHFHHDGCPACAEAAACPDV